jgi:hypothetical protein
MYYRICSWNIGTWGQVDLSQFNACFGLALLSAVNLLSLLALAGVSQSFISEPTFLAVIAASFAAHHLHFVKSGRCLQQPQEFYQNAPFSPPAGLALVWLYAAGSLAIFVVVLHASRAPSAV